MERCNYIVHHTSWMVEMGGQYHQTILSLWISHLVHNLALSPVMLAHSASAQLTNPSQITSQPGTIISFVTVSFRSSILTSKISTQFRSELHTT